MGLGRRLRYVAAVSAEAFSLLCGKRRWFRVRGESMLPTFQPGDCILVDTSLGQTVPLGVAVVVQETRSPGSVLVKRLASRGGSTFAVTSDNPLQALDSRTLGSFSNDQLIGRVSLVFTTAGKLRLSDDAP